MLSNEELGADHEGLVASTRRLDARRALPARRVRHRVMGGAVLSNTWPYRCPRSNTVRAVLVHHLYDLTSGDTSFASVECDALAEQLGWSSQETDDVVQYLVDHQLLRFVVFGAVSITPSGVDEVERLGLILSNQRTTSRSPTTSSSMVTSQALRSTSAGQTFPSLNPSRLPQR